MKKERENIIQELKELGADFLLRDKQRADLKWESDTLSKEFYDKIWEQTSKKTRVIPIVEKNQRNEYTRRARVLRIVASVFVLIAISGITYSLIKTNNLSKSNHSGTLEQLVSQTSSQEIYDYLYETSVQSDEDFLYPYASNSSLN